MTREAQFRSARDSPLEGDGFELAVPGTVHLVSATVVPLGCLGRVHVAATALMAGRPFKRFR